MSDEDPDFVAQSVDDPEDFAQKQRMRQIYDARKEFLKARADAPEKRRENNWPSHVEQDYILNAAQRYFFEVEGLMRRHPDGDYYLNDVRLGGVMRLENIDRENGDRAIIKPPDEEFDPDRAFVGLTSIAKKYKPIRTAGYSTGERNRSTEKTAVLVTVPVDVSVRAYREINKFLAEVGLDADMEGEQKDAVFDYSDILQDGPPDDGEKPDIAADGGGDE